MEAWIYELKKKREKRGMAKVKEKEPWCPIVTFPFPWLFKFLNQDTRECRDLKTETCSLNNWPPPSPPPHTHQAPPYFKLWISPCIRVGEGEFVDYYPRWRLFVILQINIKATCCIKNGFWIDILPRKAFKCC